MFNRILVVEDEETVRITLAGNLELAGFVVLEAESGEQALALLEREAVDLVLSDIKMPGMTGVELYFKIRARWADVPVVLMTAFAVEDQVHRAVENGVYTVLGKPFQLDHAVRTLKNAVRRPLVLVHEQGAETATALERMGLKARAVADADAAVQELRGAAVDVCVADALVAGSTVQAMQDANVPVPLVVMAEQGSAGLAQLAAKGVYAFVPKPVAPAELMAVIAKARGDGKRGRP